MWKPIFVITVICLLICLISPESSVLAVPIGFACIYAFAKASIHEKEKKRALAAKRAEVRNKSLKKIYDARDNSESRLHELLKKPSLPNLREARQLIDQDPGDTDEDDELFQKMMKEVARQDAEGLVDAMYQEIQDYHFKKAQKYIGFLNYIEYREGYAEIADVSRKLEKYKEFSEAETARIVTNVYGMVHIPETNNQTTGTFDIVAVEDLSELIWQVTFRKPFDQYAYRIVASQFAGLRRNKVMPLDMLCSLIYMETTENKDIVEGVCGGVPAVLQELGENYSVIALKSIASVAAWCENRAVEKMALDLIGRKGELTDQQQKRLMSLN